MFPNFSLDSHYDENGKPKRKYRVRWQRWSRKSLAVCYDEMSGEVFVDELIQEKNKLILHKKNVSLSKYTKKISKTMGKIKYVIRKYYLFFIINFCVDGKLFDMQALKFEVRKNG